VTRQERFEVYSQQLSAALFDAEVTLRYLETAGDLVSSEVDFQAALARARAALRVLESL